MRYVFQVSVHIIWRERNKKRHGKQPTLPTILNQVIDHIARKQVSSLLDLSSNKFEDGLRIIWFGSRNYQGIFLKKVTFNVKMVFFLVNKIYIHIKKEFLMCLFYKILLSITRLQKNIVNSYKTFYENFDRIKFLPLFYKVVTE